MTPREFAASKGERTYIGKPCKRGHDGIRRTLSGACVACTNDRSRQTAERLRKLFAAAK